ncbi:MAG: hypothetical protein PHQ64_02475 [Bacilli bacterium]|nr:hypothetical protein [Bacilli bacterium]
MMDSQPAVHLIPYKKDALADLIGWDGFISKEGIFYKTSERTTFDFGHDIFAEYFYLKETGKDISEGWDELISRVDSKNIDVRVCPTTMLINLLGFVHYEGTNKGAHVTLPNTEYQKDNYTNEQLDVISELARVNGDRNIELVVSRNLNEIKDRKEARVLSRTGR